MTEPFFTKKTKCRLCGNETLTDLFTLGDQYVVDFVKSPDDDLPKAPLQLEVCSSCQLVQLQHSVNPDRLYKKFWYRSGVNEQMKTALEDIVDRAREVVALVGGETVLDIGANDGTLLGWYPGNIRTVGVDPCAELIEDGLKHRRMDIGLKGFFSKEIVEPHGPYKVITAIAMFYDLEDPVQFLKDCKSVLMPDGVLIVQMNYLTTMMRNMAVDNICHEHLTYFSMLTFKRACDAADLEIVGAEENDVNGGSFRVYMTHRSSSLYGMSSQKQLNLFTYMMGMTYNEQKNGLDRHETYMQFGKQVKQRVDDLREYLIGEAESGSQIYAYGASTRGTVLLQLLNLPEGVLRGVAERDTNKFGLHMVGSWLPILPEQTCREKATHFLVLPYHFKDSIIKREEDWVRNGGKLVFPMPTVQIVGKLGTSGLTSRKDTGVIQ